MVSLQNALVRVMEFGTNQRFYFHSKKTRDIMEKSFETTSYHLAKTVDIGPIADSRTKILLSFHVSNIR